MQYVNAGNDAQYIKRGIKRNTKKTAQQKIIVDKTATYDRKCREFVKIKSRSYCLILSKLRLLCFKTEMSIAKYIWEKALIFSQKSLSVSLPRVVTIYPPKGWIFRRTDFTIPIWFQNYSKIIWDTLKSTTRSFLNTTPSDTSRRLWASIPPNAYDRESCPLLLTTRWQGICSGSGLLWRIFPTARAKFLFPRCKAICP